MFEVARKFLLTRKLELREGEILLMGQRIMFVPVGIFVEMLKLVEDEEDYWEVARIQYEAAKLAVYEWFREFVAKGKLDKERFLRWGTDIFHLAGWGVIKMLTPVVEVRRGRLGIARVENSSVGKEYFETYGKSRFPVCHIIRGGCAGAVLVLHSLEDVENLELIELECVATGYSSCLFVGGYREKLIEKFGDKPDLLKQLPEYV